MPGEDTHSHSAGVTVQVGGGGVDERGGCLFHFEGLSLARTSNGDCSRVKQNISSAEGYCRVPCMEATG